MKKCEELRELIAWYVEGSLSSQESAEVAAHLGECAECLQEMAAATRLRVAVRDALSALPEAPDTLWEQVSRELFGRRLAQLDVGSFLVGLRLGAWLTQRGSSVRANLRVMGRDVQLFRARKGDE
jgi:anti-sigma factor RsiW